MKEKERNRGTEGETSTPTDDALIGDEDQNGKQKKTKIQKQGTGPQPSYRGPFNRLLRRAGIIR